MFFPSHHQTLVLPVGSGKAISMLKKSIANKKNTSSTSDSVFTGTLKKGDFRLMPHQKTGNNFTPIIQGEILNSSKGTIVRSWYSINKNTKWFLIFISSLCLLSGTLMLLLDGSIIKSLLIFAVGLSNYGLSVYQYNREVKRTIESFHKVFGDHPTTD